MKTFLLAITILMGLLLAVFGFERLFVQRTLGPAALASLVLLTVVFLTVLAMYLAYDRKQELITNIVMATVSTVVTYVLVDLAAGFILIKRLSPPLVPDPYVHHRMVPNSQSSFSQPDFHYVQRVNNLGMRGHDVVVAKPTGAFRILMLGDSFTMGKGVEDNQTFSVLVEQGLRQRVAACGSRTSIEVLNGGVDSYAPILSYLELSRSLGALNPDVVIENLDNSDLIQETAYRLIAARDAEGRITGVPQAEQATSLTDRLRDWIDSHLFITRALVFYLVERAGYREFTVRSVVEQANVELALHTLAEDREPRDEQWARIGDSLSMMKHYADEHGASLFLSIYPWGHQVRDSEWVPGRWAFMSPGQHAADTSRQTAQRLAAERQIPVIDLFPAFRGYQGDRPLYFQHDNHWTTVGHEVAAAAFTDYLSSRYLDHWCGAPAASTK